MVFQRSDLELVLQQIVLAGELHGTEAPPAVLAAATQGAPSDAADAATLPAEEARIVEALRDAILATNDLDFINSWLAEDIDELPTDEAGSAALAWDLERVIAAARKIAVAAAQDATAHTPQPAGASLLLNASRAELIAANGDENLRPFASWAELLASLKQTDRVIELIARYGTHEALLAAATLAEKRTVASLLVLGAKDTNGNGVLDESEVAPADRLDFLHAHGEYAGGSLGGLNLVELKFAGLAAATSPVNADFSFESELETLQGASVAEGPEAGDAGQVTAISNGSSVILTGDDAGDVAGDEAAAGSEGPAVDGRQQFIRVGLDGRAVEDDGVGLTPLAATDLVLVGTEAADVLAGSAGNDTITGEAGNDRLSGNAGNDKISGGDGNDVVSGGAGDDQLQGDDGNDVLVTGEGSDTADGGAGNDYILADSEDTATGGDGDDWIEGSGDAAGDAEDETGGNDVIVLTSDQAIADGGAGSDIIVAADGGSGQYHGGRGFDWISHYHGPQAETGKDDTDHDGVEGLSGSGGDDHIQGDDRGSDQIADGGDALSDVALVSGLQAFLEETLGGASGVAVFDGGNIILGGGGSDIIQGGGGNDLIDGDLTLEVRILVDANGNGIADEGELSVASLEEIDQQLLDGEIDASELTIVREITNAGAAGDIDTAVYSGQRNEYEISLDGNVTTVTHHLLDDSGQVISDSTGCDGTDRLTNIERLQFADQVLVLTKINGDTYAWQVPVALAMAIADAIESDSSHSGSGSSGGGGSGGGDAGDLLDQLAAAALDPDLSWLFDDASGHGGDEFDFSSLSTSDFSAAIANGLVDGQGAGSDLDLSGIEWLLGSDGDMFVFPIDSETAQVLDIQDYPIADDTGVIPLGTIDDSYVGYQVELVGVHDIMATDYAV